MAVEISPFCAHLSSKKACFLAAPPRAAEDLLDASQHVWCSRTMEAVGPDDGLVDVEGCRAGRACFVAYGSMSPRR